MRHCVCPMKEAGNVTVTAILAWLPASDGSRRVNEKA